MCRSWCEAILAVVILVFTFWNTWAYSQWVVALAAVVLLIHAFMCTKCFGSHTMTSKKK